MPGRKTGAVAVTQIWELSIIENNNVVSNEKFASIRKAAEHLGISYNALSEINKGRTKQKGRQSIIKIQRCKEEKRPLSLSQL